MFLPFRMVCRMYALTHFSSVAAFSKIYKVLYIYIDGLEYLLGKGYKSALYLWGKNIARVFLYRLIVFSHYSLGPEYSFVKKRKDKSFFNRNTCGQQEKNQWLG